MINFIYGAYGCGKTGKILDMLSADCNNGSHSFLIVPDQEALQFERLTLSVLPPKAQLNLEVLGFSRLYNRVCREYGGLSYSYITKPMRSLLMWKSLHTLSDLLESYNKNASADFSLSDDMLSAINEFKANGVSAVQLEIAGRHLPKDSPLAARLRDLSMIYSYFDDYIAEKYTDSADDLSRLYDCLCENDFFLGTNVYIDSFYSFTAVQHRIIEEMFKGASNVTITIPLAAPNTDDISTAGIRASEKKLIEAAMRYGKASVSILKDNKRALSPCLSYLSKNIWTLDANAKNAPNYDGSIICECCENPYTEAEAVSAHILKLMRNGARAKDMVIIARDAEKYRGIIDTALKKSGIPYYMSQKSDLCSMPAVKLLLCALRIKKYNWRRRDVIAYIKTGLCGIDPHEANLFEEYINTWNIQGERFSDAPWTMNPDGIVATISPRGEEILCAANKVREQIVNSLYKYFVLLDAAKNTAEMCKATYGYMVDINLEERLAEISKSSADRGDIKQARDFSVLYSTIVSLLAEIGEALCDEECETEEFIELLKHIFDKTEIGSIPTSIDEVTIGSAALLRASNPKYAFVIGLCEGEFPASVSDTGVFSTTDRQMLSSLGIELSGDIDTRSSDELMYVARAFSTASDKLFLFTHKAEISGTACFPSLAFNRVQKLFSSLYPHNYQISDLEYLIPAPKNAASLYRSLENSPKKEALKTALGKQIPEFEKLSQDTVNEECKISNQTVSEVIGTSLRLSPTSFEKYAKCPFNYFCSEVLGLRENASSQFRANNIGSFVHRILEILVKNAIPAPGEIPPDDETLLKLANETVEDYIQKICPPSMIVSKRMKHLYDRLCGLSFLLVKNTVREFSKSEFRPAFFELRANGENGSPNPLVFKLSNGTKLSFTGVIDRVDVYKKEDDVYIRVVDYKTGEKLFSIDDIESGINLQMLLYLFTLCRTKSSSFKRAIGITNDKNPLPAGVIYLSTAIPTIDADDFCSSSSILSTAEDLLPRTGLLLDDEDILLAMNSDLDEKFLAGISRRSDSTLTGKALTSAEQFADIYNQIEHTVVKIADELQSGNADAHPYADGKDSPCQYCSLKPICRKTRK